MNSRALAFIIVFILVVIAGFIFGPKLVKDESPTAKEPLDLEYDVNLSAEGKKPVLEDKEDKKESAVVNPSPYPAPDLDRPVVIYSNIPEETKKMAKDRIVAVTKNLQSNNALFDDWIELGAYRKLIGDINGALEIWSYVSALNPSSHVAYNNIATLYASYIRDYPKAEEYYLKAIQAAPNLPYPYFAAFEFYKSVLKDDKKAEDIVQRGIVAVPSAKAEFEALLD